MDGFVWFTMYHISFPSNKLDKTPGVVTGLSRKMEGRQGVKVNRTKAGIRE